MIQQLFLSLINGISVLIGIEPHSVFFFVEKMGKEIDSGVKAACWAGLLNALVLLYLKYRSELTQRNLLVYLIIPALFYQVFCASYFNVWVVNLRIFSWIIIATVASAYFLLQLKGDSKNLLYPIIAVLAYLAQIPGSAGLLILILFLRANKFSATSSVLLVLVSLAPGFLYSFFVEGYDFVKNSEPANWLLISGSYLLSCFAMYFSAFFLIKIFKVAREKILINTAIGIGLALLFLTSRMGDNLKGEKALRYSFSSMGTTCEITLWTNQHETAELSFKEAKDLVDSIEASLSTYKADSEINAMNAEAAKSPFKCSQVLWENLLLAEYAYKISNGGFDVTIGPLVKLWSIKKKRSELPSSLEIEKVLETVGFDKLKLDKDKKTVFFSKDGLKVDFGGLTKGWAVDKAAALLYRRGFNKFIVNLGGNLYTSTQAPEDKGTYKIGIKDPKYPNKLCAKVGILGKAVSTSGNYEQYIIIDKKRYTHIIDPRTGYPVGEVDSVTVICPSAVLSDILSTSIFVEGVKSIQDIQKQVKDLSILFIDIQEEGENSIFKNGLFENIEIKLHQ